MSDTIEQLIDFSARSPVAFWAAENFAALLRENGYQELSETARWSLEPGGQYFVRRNNSSLIAFQLPANRFHSFQIMSAHGDSPAFKVKANPEMPAEGVYTRLNVEKYGGMLCAPWFDRPLSVAGRLIVRDGDRFVSKLVNVERDLLMIPNLAIHMDRTQNDGRAYSIQTDMIPLLGDASEPGCFRRILAEAAGVQPEDIAEDEVYLYNRTRGTIWGAHREFFSAPRLDDLECAYSIVRGLLAAQGHPDSVSVCAVFDNEETGSSSKQGALGTFLPDVLRRITLSAGLDEEEHRRTLSTSFMVSADNAHAVHPNHPEKADPINRPQLNGGPVVKYHGSQRYTTDSVSAALFREICRRADVPTQTFTNRSDARSGGTLGNLSTRQVSINCVDIGLPQLSMHSPYETGGVKDVDYLIAASREFFNSSIRADGLGQFTLHTTSRA